jgi:hypothetical protein
VPRRKLFQRLQNFIFAWPGDEHLQVGFNGDVFIVPPRDEIAEVGMGSPYRFPSAVDGKGRPIPGTIAIQDKIRETDAGGRGGYVKLFDAAECCAWLEDTREDLFDQGFAICMDPEEVVPAQREGRPKYDASQDDYAREILHQELERRKRWDVKGVPAPPSSSDHKVRWAVAHLEQRKSKTAMLSEDALKGALGAGVEYVDNLPPVAPRKSDEEPKEMIGSVPKDEAVTALPPTELWEMAQAAGIKPTKPEMAKLLEGDEAYRALLLEQIAEKQEGERAPA